MLRPSPAGHLPYARRPVANEFNLTARAGEALWAKIDEGSERAV
jgi:hypothetical protein